MVAPKKKKSSQKNNSENAHVYTLHIDALPTHKIHSGVTAGASGHGAAIHIGHVKNPFEEQDKPNAFFAFIWDKLQFVLVTVGVFLVIYVTMNWSALTMLAEHYWNVWRGYESPLQQIVETPVQEPEKLLTTPTPTAIAVIPPLNIEVFPTDMRVIIPRINQNVPVVGVKNDNLIARNWKDLEADIQKALRNGVIHYPGTALPGENGNTVITGHSSYYAWDPGRFKDVFALLHDVKNGDKIVVYFNQRKYTYEVSNIKVVFPKEVDVLAETDSELLTLITCTPIGTNLKRLIVQAKLVSKT